MHQSRPLRFRRWTVCIALLGAAVGMGACRKKPPKLSKSECQTFCQRLVPCFAEKMGMFSKSKEADIRECVDNCQGAEGQRNGDLLRAMKRCGHLTDCQKLRSCFNKSLGGS